jgi:hypothetical protein
LALVKDAFVFTTPSGGDHLKMLPSVDAFKRAVVPKQIMVSFPAKAIGYGTVLTLISADVLQLPMFATRWYFVALFVVAIGCWNKCII